MMLPDSVGWIIYLNLALSFSSGVVIGATEIISTFQYRKKLLATLSFWALSFFTAFLDSPRSAFSHFKIQRIGTNHWLPCYPGWRPM